VRQSKIGHMYVGHWSPYESLSEPWCMRMSLIGSHAIVWTMLCTVLLDQEADYYMGNSMY
jgi:hypothetical protein